jgi:hypothetical protein
MQFPFFIALTCLSTILLSQDIPNSGFEDWTDCVAWSTPIGFVSDNSLNYTWNQTLSVEKSTQSHSGNYAAYLHCITSSPGVGSLQWSADTTFADFNIGTLAPFQGTPDSLVFWAKTNAGGGGESLVSAYLFNQESFSAIAEIYFSQNGLGYTRYSVPFTYTGDDPDGIFLSISSSYLETTNTEMWIDDIELIYNNGSGDQIPNGGFENWSDYLMPCLDSWTGSNWRTVPTFSVTPGEPRSGNYSARITNETTVYFADTLGYILLGSVWANDLCNAPSLQMPQGQALTNLQGYYKYEPSNPLDTASAVIFYYAIDEFSLACVEVYRLRSYLPAASEWTPFSLSVPGDTIQSWEEGDNPLFAMIGFYSYKNQGGGFSGSELLVDDLHAAYTTVNVNEMDGLNSFVCPNPANDELNVQLPRDMEIHVQLFDMLGQCLKNVDTRGTRVKISTSELSSGMYTLTTTDGNASSSHRIMVQH